MKRKKSAALPRLTMLAMSRKELTAFVSSIDVLRTTVLNLGDEVARLRDLVDRLTVARARRRPAAAELPNGQGAELGDADHA